MQYTRDTQSQRGSISSATTETSPQRKDTEKKHTTDDPPRGGILHSQPDTRDGCIETPETGTVEDSSPIWRYLLVELDPRRADVVLIICGFVSGLVDGLSFNAWGSFSSMQTGNTVFIALGVSGQPEYPAYLWAKSLIALTVFLLSNIFFIYVSRTLNPLRRVTLILSFGLQTAALIIAASVVQAGIVDPKPEDPRAPIQWMQILPITLLAFQAAGQICVTRLLAFDEIPTLVVTTLLCDLLVDANLYVRPWSANPKRNRRIASFLALFLGAMTAGGLSRTTGMASSLWLAVALKSTITLGWFFWKDGSGDVRSKSERNDSPV